MRRSRPSFEMLKAKESSLLRMSDRALGFVYLQVEVRGQEVTHTGHNPFPGPRTANVDVAVIGIPAEPVAPTHQLLIEVVQQQVAQKR